MRSVKEKLKRPERGYRGAIICVLKKERKSACHQERSNDRRKSEERPDPPDWEER